jgi:hypothetical protein
MVDPALASRPSVTPAIEAVSRFKAKHADSLSPVNRGKLDEIRRRLERLEGECGRLVRLNNARLEHQPIQVDVNPADGFDVLTFNAGDESISLKIKRADPNVPISARSVLTGEAYVAGAEQGEGIEADRFETAFEGLLEGYYNNAHRVLKLVKSLPGFKGFKCSEITMVRNHLVEHPAEGEAYSFGFGSTGPVVRPIHSSGQEWTDPGLVPNTEAFVSRLVRAFGKADEQK